MTKQAIVRTKLMALIGLMLCVTSPCTFLLSYTHYHKHGIVGLSMVITQFLVGMACFRHYYRLRWPKDTASYQ